MGEGYILAATVLQERFVTHGPRGEGPHSTQRQTHLAVSQPALLAPPSSPSLPASGSPLPFGVLLLRYDWSVEAVL